MSVVHTTVMDDDPFLIVEDVKPEVDIFETENLSQLSPLGRQLRDLCRAYWAKQVEGWGEIIKTRDIDVPTLVGSLKKRDDKDEEKDLLGQPPKYSSECYRTICLPEDSLSGIYSTELVKEIYIRGEYQELYEELKQMHDEGRRGAIVVGQPGVGEIVEVFWILSDCLRRKIAISSLPSYNEGNCRRENDLADIRLAPNRTRRTSFLSGTPDRRLRSLSP